MSKASLQLEILVLASSLLLLIFPGTSLANKQPISWDGDKEIQEIWGQAVNFYPIILNHNHWSPKVINLFWEDYASGVFDGARVRCNIADHEPVNDNSNPLTFNESAFKDEGNVAYDFKFYAQAAQKEFPLMPYIWNLPSWLVDGKTIDPADYDELAELIAHYILYAISKGGSIPGFGIQNEPNIGTYVKYTAEELANANEVVFRRLGQEELGYVQTLLGDTNKPLATQDFFVKSALKPVVYNHAIGISYHLWENLVPGLLQDHAETARLLNVGIIGAEIGGKQGEGYSIESALKLIERMDYFIRYGEGNVPIVWAYGGAQDSIIGKDGTPYTSYHMWRMFALAFSRDTTIIESSKPAMGIYVLGGIHYQDRRCFLSVLNKNTHSKELELKMTTSGHVLGESLSMYTSSPNMQNQYMGEVGLSNNVATFTVAPQSYSVLTTSCAPRDYSDRDSKGGGERTVRGR